MACKGMNIERSWTKEEQRLSSFDLDLDACLGKETPEQQHDLLNMLMHVNDFDVDSLEAPLRGQEECHRDVNRNNAVASPPSTSAGPSLSFKVPPPPLPTTPLAPPVLVPAPVLRDGGARAIVQPSNGPVGLPKTRSKGGSPKAPPPHAKKAMLVGGARQKPQRGKKKGCQTQVNDRGQLLHRSDKRVGDKSKCAESGCGKQVRSASILCSNCGGGKKCTVQGCKSGTQSCANSRMLPVCFRHAVGFKAVSKDILKSLGYVWREYKTSFTADKAAGEQMADNVWCEYKKYKGLS